MNLLKITTGILLAAALSLSGYKQSSDVTGNEKATEERPDSTRFTHMILANGFDEPMEMAILPGMDVLIVERKGALKRYDAKQKQVRTIAQFNVFSGIEDGLLGIAVDPNYEANHWIYVYYGVAGDRNVSNLERYAYADGKLDMSSRKVLLEIPTQRTYCCHSAGYLTFDNKGFLYLSTGDNTNAEEIEGHNPTDERPGRQLSDDQGTTANTKDYRGKILRIKPEDDGTYSIPDGNLFPKDGSLGHPEIYVMGCRNPFRVSIDPHNGYVYWGDVGPDTQIKAEEGFLSYDEINQARKPGFFGYPYFLGANEAFPKYDFATKQEGPPQDPARPMNLSPNNTGIQELPPAQPAMIWYGKQASKRWPLVGKGGASAMAGPVYYTDQYPEAPHKLPAYYNGKLFIYDWIRKWIMAVTLDANGNYQSMEPFLPHLKVVAPMDMKIASDGAVYLLAYGTNWFARNGDAGLIRVEYSEGNRNPIAEITIDKSVGAAPLRALISADQSRDFDKGDSLTYAWSIGADRVSGKSFRYQFAKPGVYDVSLTVSDQNGGKGYATTQVKVGNTPPVVTIASIGNQSFYWDKGAFDYRIKVTDAEDKVIDPRQIKSSFDYLEAGKDLASALAGNTHSNSKFAAAANLYATLDCKACHTMDTKSIGPSLKQISQKYQGKAGADRVLAHKVIQGGSGNWGSYPMPPHTDLPAKDALAIVRYILSVGEDAQRMPVSGVLSLGQHTSERGAGAYVFQASYTDLGANGIEPLTTRTHVALRSPLVQMEDYEDGAANVVIGTLNTGHITSIWARNNKFVAFKNIDLAHIKNLVVNVQQDGAGGILELRLDSKTGPSIGQLTIPAGKIAPGTDIKSTWQEMTMQLKPVTGFHDLYFTFKNESKGTDGLFFLDWIYFKK